MSKKKTTEQFIEEAKEIHGDKYDYSKVEYANNKTKVCIICPIHGEFWQRPDKHLSRRDGCEKCGILLRTQNNSSTTEEFIEKARNIHRNRYDYSKVEYTKSSEKICIICPEHGEFWQIANDHIRWCGCPICKQSNLEKEIMNKLEDEKIPYICQCNNKTFSWLGRQTLDFYLPLQKIAIECQGRQHFEPIDYFGGEYEFSKCIKRDMKKKKLCDNNNISVKYYATDLRIKKNNMFFNDIDKLFNAIKNE